MKGEKSKSRANRTDSKLSVRNGGVKGKAAKGPIRPKQPPFPLSDLSHFKWKTFVPKCPNNRSPLALIKAARAEWETMSDAEKAPYVAMAEESMKEYETRSKEYWKRLAEYNEYIYAADYKNSQAATNVEEEVRINLAGLMIRQ